MTGCAFRCTIKSRVEKVKCVYVSFSIFFLDKLNNIYTAANGITPVTGVVVSNFSKVKNNDSANTIADMIPSYPTSATPAEIHVDFK